MEREIHFFYIDFKIKCEWSELVECKTYLPFIIKMECDNYYNEV